MSLLLRAVPYLIAALLCGFAGHKLTENHYVAVIAKADRLHAKEIADIKQQTIDDAAAEAKAAADRMRAVQSLADVLSDNLSSLETRIQQSTLEKTRAIPKLATGSTCFGADLTRLLNNQIGEPFTIAETPSAPAAEDEAVATDTDVAGWIAFAQGEYETCRARLGALIDFELRKE